MMVLPPLFSSFYSDEEVKVVFWRFSQRLCVDTEDFVDRRTEHIALDCHGRGIIKVLYVVLDPFRGCLAHSDGVSRLRNGNLGRKTDSRSGGGSQSRVSARTA